jgi:two-component system osmolarity sensor histidine kinase EnvZ
VLADDVELARVISNLLENARRYGKSRKTGIAHVHIAAKERDEWVLMKFRDHGVGVPAEKLASLTKPFFRLDEARTEATGAGLGLSIVDKTVQRMGAGLHWPTPHPVVWPRTSNSGGLSRHHQTPGVRPK